MWTKADRPGAGHTEPTLTTNRDETSTDGISRDDRETAEAQMALYALKDGLDPCGKEWRHAVAQLRDHRAQGFIARGCRGRVDD